MQHWYVYYKVPAGDAETIAARVRAMFDTLAPSGTPGRLLRRTDAGGGEITLMEVYEPIVDANRFAAALDGAVRRSGLSADVIARRRVERFEDC
jgi:hypothetical protein